MANTTNFGWETPDDTDLVKDGAAAIRTLGQAIDTSLMDLEGGTTDQVLAKNSNADMDFKWVTSDDANAIQNAIVDAKGDIVAASANDTPARLAVGTNNQRLVAASGETTGLKYVSDTQNTVVDAAGDLLYGTAADTLDRLAIGTAGQILKVNSGATAPEWGAASAGALTLVKSQTIGSAVASVTVTDAFSSTYDNYLILIYGGAGSARENLLLTLGATTSDYYRFAYFGEYSASTLAGNNTNNGSSFRVGRYGSNGMAIELLVFRPNNTARTNFTSRSAEPQTDGAVVADSGFLNNATAYTAFTLTCGGATTLTGGTIKVYGYSN